MKTQPIIGWRVWKVRADNLWALNIPHHWWPGVNRAWCHIRSYFHHPAVLPDSRCSCGWYGMPYEYAADAWRQMEAHTWRYRRVVGAAFYWGRTVRHRLGVRAEFAAVGCIVGSDRVHKRVADAYGVPLVETLEDSLAWARAQDAVVLDGGYPIQQPVLGYRELGAEPPLSYHPARQHEMVVVHPPVKLHPHVLDGLVGSAIEPICVCGCTEQKIVSEYIETEVARIASERGCVRLV